MAMAKKKRRHFIKLNNRIKEIFSGKSFDTAISDVDDELLMELLMLLELKLPYLDRDEMLRTLRREWSDGDYKTRKIIVERLSQEYGRGKKSRAPKSDSRDTIEEMAYILDELGADRDEEQEVLDSLLESKKSSVSRDKIEKRLAYIRRRRRLERICSILEASFNDRNELEFVSAYEFSFSAHSFVKYLLTRTEAVDIDSMLEERDEDIVTTLEHMKSEARRRREEEISLFVSSLHEHRYLGERDAEISIRRAPLQSELYHIPIPYEIVRGIVDEIDPNIYIMESQEHFGIEKSTKFELFGTTLEYRLKLSYEKSFLYSSIWQESDLPLEEDFATLKNSGEELFLSSVEALKERMREQAGLLEIEDGEIERFILQFLEGQIAASGNLRMKEKTRKRILFHFSEYLKPLKEKRLREELLAKTIRDFKMLFPLARSLKRKIVLHAGPTNSGKTWEAMEKLRQAETGYYLAPLRLLALEGYENLVSHGVKTSLITGEEEILDEDSTHISSTIEMLNSEVEVELSVIDEIQMIEDRDRGWAWANALIGVPAKELILTGSENVVPAIKELCRYLGEELEIKYFERKNPLELMQRATALKRVKAGTAIVAFSRKEVLSLKQRLSHKYRVSVVYGNLSPEVRREEARRFREGESEVLVATDAIAMGLNLPIKTILFARDNKFDGLRRRELSTSEILQVAGRAGRYKIHEHGYVGALDEKTLRGIKERFHGELPPITLPVSVMAGLEHVLLIGEILETGKLTEILDFFSQNMKFEGPFVAANIDSMLELASIVDEYDFDLKSRYHLSCAPVSINSPYLESVFHRYLRELEKGKEVKYIEPRKLPPFAHTNEELLYAEDRVKEVSLYLWLSFKFRDKFKDTEKAIEGRKKLNRFIENSLQRGDFKKSCRRCGRELDFSYSFSICEKCYKKGKRGSFYKKRE